MSVHPSGWFRYANESFEPRRKQRKYTNCTLLCDLPFEESRQHMMVTFHQDEVCVQGAWLTLVVETEDGHLMGWTDDDDPVLDLYWRE